MPNPETETEAPMSDSFLKSVTFPDITILVVGVCAEIVFCRNKIRKKMTVRKMSFM